MADKDNIAKGKTEVAAVDRRALTPRFHTRTRWALVAVVDVPVRVRTVT